MMENNSSKNNKPSAVVITPTTGGKGLAECRASIFNQDYTGKLVHQCVGDGYEYYSEICRILNKYISSSKPTNIIASTTFLSRNVGANGFYGHRIYAAFPHLVDEDYVFFLDQDNTYEPNHVSTMVSAMEQNGWDWAYSLRNFVKDGVSEPDLYESIGEWSILKDNTGAYSHLVDTSCFGFKRSWLINHCQKWHWGWGGDRRFFQYVREELKHTNYGTTGLHTMNYELGSPTNPITMEGVRAANKWIKENIGNELPWHKQAKP